MYLTCNFENTRKKRLTKRCFAVVCFMLKSGKLFQAPPLPTYHFPLITSHLSLPTSHLSLITSHLSLPTYHLSLPTSHLSLPTYHFPLLTYHFSHVHTHSAKSAFLPRSEKCHHSVDVPSRPTASMVSFNSLRLSRICLENLV